jgi:hypothetical protein
MAVADKSERLRGRDGLSIIGFGIRDLWGGSPATAHRGGAVLDRQHHLGQGRAQSVNSYQVEILEKRWRA